jgi:hypothetical protein
MCVSSPGVQISPVAHPATYPIATKRSTVKQMAQESNRAPLSSAKVNNGGTTPLLPIHLHDVVPVKTGKFTFYAYTF